MLAGADHRAPYRAVPLCWPVCCAADGVVVSSRCCTLANHHDVLRYGCRRGSLDSGQPRCIAFGGMSVDETIANEVLRVVQPAAVEAAVLASEEETRKQDDVLDAW